MAELKRRLGPRFTTKYAEQSICGKGIGLRVDFWISAEDTIIEIAMSLKNPNSEYERDLMKAILAKRAGIAVKKLIFLSKQGAKKTHNNPSSRAFRELMRKQYGIEVDIREFN
jgi:hypothetical protein